MKQNYHLLFKEELKHIQGKPKLLLHVCCGPCSGYILTQLLDYFDITLFYSNSNIYPPKEYNRRKDELIEFVSVINKELNQNILIIDYDYDVDQYHKKLEPLKDTGEKGLRCKLCYSLRMNDTYNYALVHQFDYWTTSLSISPHKNSQWINEIGESLNKDQHFKFLYADFKKDSGYLKATQLSDEYNMYRQDYCGCRFSLEERDSRNK